jgi:hypothetical protein
MAQVVEHLSSKCEALSSNSILLKKKKKSEQDRQKQMHSQKAKFNFL